MGELKVGDTIKCHDACDAANMMDQLSKEGYETDFLYMKDGQKGLWLEIVEVEDAKSNS